VRDAENEVRSAAEAQSNRAVADAREATRKQVTEELEGEFKNRLAETTAQLKSEAASEREPLQQQLEQWRTFAEIQQQLAEASSQSEILSRFLRLVRPFAARLGVYVIKADGLALWKSRGDGAFPEIISQQTTDPESYFRAITVRGKTVAAVSAMPPFKPEALEFLSTSLERAIEVYALRLKTPVPKSTVASEKTIATMNTGNTANTGAPAPGPDDQKAHSEARRIARLLVSEIKLYHEQELRKGREHSDIYERLQKEIDLGREMYSQRVPASVIGAHDYFHEELVRILGENDVSRLGAAYPGPKNS